MSHEPHTYQKPYEMHNNAAIVEDNNPPSFNNKVTRLYN